MLSANRSVITETDLQRVKEMRTKAKAMNKAEAQEYMTSPEVTSLLKHLHETYSVDALQQLDYLANHNLL